MTNINYVTAIGNLVRDVETTQPSQGFTVGRGTIAVNRTKVTNGQKIDEVSYFDIRIFGKLAETLKPYLLKGTKVAIVGYLKQERWTDKNTNSNRSAVYIGVNELELLSSKSECSHAGNQMPNYNAQQGFVQQPQNYQQPYQQQGMSNFPEDYPF